MSLASQPLSELHATMVEHLLLLRAHLPKEHPLPLDAIRFLLQETHPSSSVSGGDLWRELRDREVGVFDPSAGEHFLAENARARISGYRRWTPTQPKTISEERIKRLAAWVVKGETTFSAWHLDHDPGSSKSDVDDKNKKKGKRPSKPKPVTPHGDRVNGSAYSDEHMMLLRVLVELSSVCTQTDSRHFETGVLPQDLFEATCLRHGDTETAKALLGTSRADVVHPCTIRFSGGRTEKGVRLNASAIALTRNHSPAGWKHITSRGQLQNVFAHWQNGVRDFGSEHFEYAPGEGPFAQAPVPKPKLRTTPKKRVSPTQLELLTAHYRAEQAQGGCLLSSAESTAVFRTRSSSDGSAKQMRYQMSTDKGGKLIEGVAIHARKKNWRVSENGLSALRQEGIIPEPDSST